MSFLFYLELYAERFGTERPRLTQDAQRLIRSFKFEGNVRELRNIAERTSVLHEGEVVTGEIMEKLLYPQDVGMTEPYMPEASAEERTERKRIRGAEKEKEHIKKALEEAGYNKSRAAENLGMDRTTLWRKMRKYDL